MAILIGIHSLQSVEDLVVGEGGVGPDAGQLQDLPEADAERPHVRLGRVLALKRREGNFL